MGGAQFGGPATGVARNGRRRVKGADHVEQADLPRQSGIDRGVQVLDAVQSK